jgi:group II intron reverse transcriptase/maturase
MVLEAIYEQDFHDCSYGFRPGRSAHQALGKFRDEIMQMNGGWVLEGDITSFFDSVGRAELRQILQKRIGDGVILRLIGKWLNAGVMEDGNVHYPERGTPQGGVISPILANIFLHEVLDTWFEREVKPRLKGPAHLVRYADDFVIVFKVEADARRVLDVLAKRFGKYGLQLHPEKTRLTPFQRPPKQGRPKTGGGTDTFDLLGFTHYWARSLKGYWVVKQKTAAGRFSRTMRSINVWCRLNRHSPIADQQQTLNAKLRGHYGYYGITGNIEALSRLQYAMVYRWWKWLSRRSYAGRLSWKEMAAILKRFPLARPRIMRPAHALANL